MFHFLRIPCSTSRIRCSTSSGIAVPLPPDSVFHFLRNTHPGPRSDPAAPHSTNTAPSTTKPNAPARRAVGAVPAAPRPGSGLAEEGSTPLPARTGRAPWAYSPNAEAILTPRDGHSRGTRRAYSPCALGVLSLRPGRTQPARRAYSPCALHILTARPGRTRRARKSARRMSSPREHCPIEARAERAVSTGTAAPWTRSGLTRN